MFLIKLENIRKKIGKQPPLNFCHAPNIQILYIRSIRNRPKNGTIGAGRPCSGQPYALVKISSVAQIEVWNLQQ